MGRPTKAESAKMDAVAARRKAEREKRQRDQRAAVIAEQTRRVMRKRAK